MAEFPALPLWTDAYLADTGHLTTIEHGAYLLLLMTAWRAGGTLPNDDKKLARYARMTAGQWARIKSTIMQFFTISPDGIYQGRLTDELVFVRQRSAKQSDSAKSKWLKEKNKRHASAYPKTSVRDMPNASQIDAPTPTPIIKGAPSTAVRQKTPKRAAKIPDDFSPDLQPAIDEGLQPQEAILSFSRFKDHAQANGRVQIDWMASWRLWYRGDIEKKNRGRSSQAQAPRAETAHQQHQRTAREAFKRANGETGNEYPEHLGPDIELERSNYRAGPDLGRGR